VPDPLAQARRHHGAGEDQVARPQRVGRRIEPAAGGQGAVSTAHEVPAVVPVAPQEQRPRSDLERRRRAGGEEARVEEREEREARAERRGQGDLEPGDDVEVGLEEMIHAHEREREPPAAQRHRCDGELPVHLAVEEAPAEPAEPEIGQRVPGLEQSVVARTREPARHASGLPASMPSPYRSAAHGAMRTGLHALRVGARLDTQE
jgi:hypothetical protein